MCVIRTVDDCTLFIGMAASLAMCSLPHTAEQILASFDPSEVHLLFQRERTSHSMLSCCSVHVQLLDIVLEGAWLHFDVMEKC